MKTGHGQLRRLGRWFAILLILVAGPTLAYSQPGKDLIQLDVHVAPYVDQNEDNAEQNRAKSIKLRQGEAFTVFVEGKILKAGYHTYPVEKAARDQKTFKSSLRITTTDGMALLKGIRETEPKLDQDKELGEIYKYKDEFTWEKDILIQDAKPGVYKVPIKLGLQVCDPKGCIPVNQTFEVSVEVVAGEPVSRSQALLDRLPPMAVAPTTEAHESVRGLVSSSAPEYKDSLDSISQILIFLDNTLQLGSDDLLAFILTGIFFGAISLITPCVFPMIPITVSFFLKQSEKQHFKPIVMASVYSFTIILVLTIAAVAFLGFFRALSINPYMNIAIGGLLVFFALSLLGWYDIELPSGLARFTSAREGSGGLMGTIFMALTFTIISFACVAPFLGAFGGMLATGSVPFSHIVLGGLAFAVTFAAPFFILALFPALLKSLPKSGSWLNAVKVVMGFLELAAAFKFFRTAELVGTSTPTIFTFDLVLGIWVAICLLCALYLLKVYRLPHDDGDREKISVPRMLWAVGFLGLGFYLLPALFKTGADGQAQRPTGDVYAWVDSFLLPDTTVSKLGEGMETGNLEYAIAEARKNLNRPGQPRRIFVDFTGKSCTNCMLNEQNVFTKPEIKQLFDSYFVVKLYTDIVPLKYFAPEVRGDAARPWADAEVNLEFQRNAFKDETLPLYAILEPREDGKVAVLGTVQGRIFEEAAFAEFLRNPGGVNDGGLHAQK